MVKKADAHYRKVRAGAGKGKGVTAKGLFNAKSTKDPHAGLRSYAIPQKTLKSVK